MTTRVLVYTRTTAYRHDSIPDAVTAVRSLGAAHGFAVDATEDPGAFETPLDPYAAVVFLSTSGDVLTPRGRTRLAAYVEGGGGFVGVHAAACTEYDWPYYGELLGARFDRHPEYQPGKALVEDHGHPATEHLPPVWEFTDEWYDFRVSPRGAVRVLASADESSYEGGGMGQDHPLVWCREQGAGRVFYTALGHASRAYEDPGFRAHLLGGITWAAGF
ncbi:ThuA domain-containing protein [Streptomyces sp. NBC_01340]|uniref:ThuA domain-containing protein n=1 Tax=unclassified Streptomyces TaxID=2593676 RepID=UPI00225913BC|nr:MULTISPECIES: ThuA domain-containing protein [unclassified Streptomyces]MCX4457706.1 ThuA domain-containing protein [Streptomyces sp. NBC_01719]MCX4497063.1 ThuA domain-containing protein [Streptomyces sp. NBC_01728]WSI41929.1 ThuA domain-containing protein [Streptomyces sp. NBC_01340]